MSHSDILTEVKPPFSPPDCPWVPVSAGLPVPENAVYQNGTLYGDKVYIGRVYDGRCIYIGTSIPKKGICIYLNKGLEVKTSQNYEVLTSDLDEPPLWFLEMLLDHVNVYLSGIDDTGETLCAGRYLDDKRNTYYGWVNRVTRSIYIPRDPSLGPQVLDKNFGVLIHRFPHMLTRPNPLMTC